MSLEFERWQKTLKSMLFAGLLLVIFGFYKNYTRGYFDSFKVPDSEDLMDFLFPFGLGAVLIIFSLIGLLVSKRKR